MPDNTYDKKMSFESLFRSSSFGKENAVLVSSTVQFGGQFTIQHL